MNTFFYTRDIPRIQISIIISVFEHYDFLPNVVWFLCMNVGQIVYIKFTPSLLSLLSLLSLILKGLFRHAINFSNILRRFTQVYSSLIKNSSKVFQPVLHYIFLLKSITLNSYRRKVSETIKQREWRGPRRGKCKY